MSKNKTQFRAQPQPCAYCGNPSSTRDHVIPEAMFTVLAPRMITVRACYECNQAKKEYDTFLAHYFAIDFRTGHHPVAQELFWGPVKRAFKRRQSPIAQIVNEQVEVRGLTTPAGIHIGPMYVANLQDDNIDTALGYIVRGFTRYHLKKTVSFAAKIEVRPLSGEDAAKTWQLMRQQGGNGPFFLGDDVCSWAFQFAHADLSIWLITFYRGMFYFVSVEPPATSHLPRPIAPGIKKPPE